MEEERRVLENHETRVFNQVLGIKKCIPHETET